MTPKSKRPRNKTVPVNGWARYSALGRIQPWFYRRRRDAANACLFRERIDNVVMVPSTGYSVIKKDELKQLMMEIYDLKQKVGTE